jgi:hypothetical protein
MLRKINEMKEDKEGNRVSNMKEPGDLYSSSSICISNAVKSLSLWYTQEASMCKTRNFHNVLVGKPLRKWSIRRAIRWDDNIRFRGHKVAQDHI